MACVQRAHGWHQGEAPVRGPERGAGGAQVIEGTGEAHGGNLVQMRGAGNWVTVMTSRAAGRSAGDQGGYPAPDQVVSAPTR